MNYTAMMYVVPSIQISSTRIALDGGSLFTHWGTNCRPLFGIVLLYLLLVWLIDAISSELNNTLVSLYVIMIKFSL